jgi:uncharacterized protein
MMSQGRHKLLFLIPVFISAIAFAQTDSPENAIFWEVSGNGLSESSYLFGSHHLFGRQYVDTLDIVNAKFNVSKTFVCESTFDSTEGPKMIQAAMMEDSTLDQLLSPEWYSRAELWLRELSQYENLSAFNKLNPAAVHIMLVNLLHIQEFGEVDKPMDVYLQERATMEGKKVIALETVDEQLKILFQSSSYKRQAELLKEFLKSRSAAKEELHLLNERYLQQNISAFELDAKEKFLPGELHAMLYERNENWMKILPSVFFEQSTFAVVGALHLAGESGLVAQLRALGFTVTPLQID